jgi:hypothetical protein
MDSFLSLRSDGSLDLPSGGAIGLSGRDRPGRAEDSDALAVPASAAYSGFRQALSPYYRLLSEIHDGDATRSPLGLVVVAALLAALLSVWRG